MKEINTVPQLIYLCFLAVRLVGSSRFAVCLMAFYALVMLQLLRTNISLSLVCMVQSRQPIISSSSSPSSINFTGSDGDLNTSQPALDTDDTAVDQFNASSSATASNNHRACATNTCFCRSTKWNGRAGERSVGNWFGASEITPKR